jgi:hypothetical protein
MRIVVGQGAARPTKYCYKIFGKIQQYRMVNEEEKVLSIPFK